MEATPKPYKIGLALSGGGAKGFAHLGVFKLLEESGLKPDIISGTSAGSLMGVLFADGYSADEIKNMFIGREFSEFAQLQIPKSGLFNYDRFQEFLQRHLRTKRIEDLPIPTVIVATDLDRGCSHEFRSGPIVCPSCLVRFLSMACIMLTAGYSATSRFRPYATNANTLSV